MSRRVFIFWSIVQGLLAALWWAGKIVVTENVVGRTPIFVCCGYERALDQVDEGGTRRHRTSSRAALPSISADVTDRRRQAYTRWRAQKRREEKRACTQQVVSSVFLTSWVIRRFITSSVLSNAPGGRSRFYIFYFIFLIFFLYMLWYIFCCWSSAFCCCWGCCVHLLLPPDQGGPGRADRPGGSSLLPAAAPACLRSGSAKCQRWHENIGPPPRRFARARTSHA